MWFYAQARMDITSPPLRRLIGGVTTVLFLRQEGQAYVFAGRVRVQHVEEGSRPVPVLLELLDLDDLKNQPEARELLDTVLWE